MKVENRSIVVDGGVEVSGIDFETNGDLIGSFIECDIGGLKGDGGSSNHEERSDVGVESGVDC